jgi:hypothetical protein
MSLDNTPSVKHFSLYQTMHDAIPSDYRYDCAIYSKTLFVSQARPRIKIQLPSIGADGIDPDIINFVAPGVPFDSRHRVHSEIHFGFLAFLGDIPQIAPLDLNRKSRFYPFRNKLHDYIVVSPVEAPPYVVQMVQIEHADPEQAIRHPLSPQEATDLGKVINELIPQPV